MISNTLLKDLSIPNTIIEVLGNTFRYSSTDAILDAVTKEKVQCYIYLSKDGKGKYYAYIKCAADLKTMQNTIQCKLLYIEKEIYWKLTEANDDRLMVLSNDEE